MKLASFDIFDTLLIRKCGAPENIFYLTALSLFGDDNAKVDYFIFWRIQAESRAALLLGEKYLSLEQIYHSFEHNYFGIGKEIAIEREREIESENLTLNPGVKAILERCRDDGKKICFISDMYLDSPLLRDILEREGCYRSGDKIYLSGEYRKSKADGGELFTIVRKELNPAGWCHYGDNKHSDVKQARRCGVRAVFVDSSFNEVEEAALNHFRLDHNVREISLLIGWMRWIRLSGGNHSQWEIAADFVAPLYISYVQLVLARAKERGVERLYFLNRDSYILYKIAKQLGGVDVRYLYISRRSLVLPAIESLTDDEFLELFDQRSLLRKNVDDIVEFIKSSRAELASYGVEFSFEKITSSRQEREVLDKILRSEFTPILKERIANEKILLCQYLKQEGLSDGLKSGLVDVGWLGTTRLMINKILRCVGERDVDLFYLGVRRDVLPMEYGEFHCYMKEAVVGLTALVENYFSVSPYSTVISYVRDGDKVLPQLKEESHSEPMKWILESNLGAAKQLVEQLQTLDSATSLSLRALSTYMLDQLRDFRQNINAEIFTQVDLCDLPAAGKRVAFAKRMNPIELFRFSVLGERVTAVDTISVTLTLGVRVAAKLIALNAFVGRVKELLLRRIKR